MRSAEGGVRKDGDSERFRPYGAWGVFGGAGSTEMARLRRSGCGGNGLGITEISPLTGLGVWGKRVADNRDGARIAQIEHRRCDISVAARAAPPQSSVRSGIAEGCLLAVSGSTEMPPLRGLGCFWRDGFYRDAAPTGLGVFLAGRVLQRCRPYGAGGVCGGTGSTEMPPLRGWGCLWRDGFYRDAAPTGLDLLLVARVLQRFRP